MSLTVTHEPDSSRYTVHRGDELQGWIDYDVAGGTLRMLHAEVPPLMRNKGVGGDVVRAILDEVRASRTEQVQPICGFVRMWMRRHPEYDELTRR
ncbi:MAG: GNAT family N-acetyltransferase [Microcella sp.]